MVFLDSSPLSQCGSRKGEPVGGRFSEPPKKDLASCGTHRSSVLRYAVEENGNTGDAALRSLI